MPLSLGLPLNGHILTALLAITLAFTLDRLVGELPTSVHPVAWFGRLVAPVDRAWDSSRRAISVGVFVALTFPLAAGAIVWTLVVGASNLDPWLGALLAGCILFTTTSLRSLLELTARVVAETEGGSARVHESIRGLVGRDTTDLSSGELRSGAVESAAENLADGLVAPLLPFALLAPVSLSLAAAATVWVKAVNTLDSMLGYPHKPVGTASARLDDVVMWVPARLAALLLALAAADSGALSRAREWEKIPASPNSGWPMATLAAILDVRLEKRDAYVLNPDRPLPTVADGTHAVALVSRAGWLAVGVACVCVLSIGLAVDGPLSSMSVAVATTALATAIPLEGVRFAPLPSSPLETHSSGMEGSQ